jgi:nucleoside-diphosphate-sugar epimerase
LFFFPIRFFSSVAALGIEKNDTPITEESYWKKEQNRSSYGLSKFMAEREVWRGIAEGFEGVILNPSVVIGPAKKDQSSGMLMDLLSKGPKFYPPGGVGLVDVRDVSKAAIVLMSAEISGERYILNSENLNYSDLLQMASEVFQNPPPRIALQDWMLEIGWIATRIFSLITGKRTRISKETARAVRRKMVYDARKIKHVLGEDLIPIRQSLQDFAPFYR